MTAAAAPTGLNIQQIRAEFPILRTTVRGRPLAYLDNAATSQKPAEVLDALHQFYTQQNASVHRGVHHLSAIATHAYEEARQTVARFLGAQDPREIVFVRGCTEAVNLVAATYGRTHIGPGDEILLTEMEHHSNILPWQILAEEKGAHLRVAPIDDTGRLDIQALTRLLTPRTRLVAVTHVSNVLGTINPVEEIIRSAHALNIPVLLDGAQAAPHMHIDVAQLGCDFYTLSGHKMYGPTGIGALYGRLELLNTLPPYQSGGSMIETVRFEHSTYAPPPTRFEAGTPNAEGAVGLAAAVRWMQRIGIEAIAQHETALMHYCMQRLSEIPGLRLQGTAQPKAAVVSFTLDGVHPHDIGTVLDTRGIAVRAGHHCCQPLMERLGLPATARASFAAYNTFEEIDRMVEAIQYAREVFS
jgi:cysteine desulfurase/selenocysteine lyase